MNKLLRQFSSDEFEQLINSMKAGKVNIDDKGSIIPQDSSTGIDAPNKSFEEILFNLSEARDLVAENNEKMRSFIRDEEYSETERKAENMARQETDLDIEQSLKTFNEVAKDLKRVINNLGGSSSESKSKPTSPAPGKPPAPAPAPGKPPAPAPAPAPGNPSAPAPGKPPAPAPAPRKPSAPAPGRASGAPLSKDERLAMSRLIAPATAGIGSEYGMRLHPIHKKQKMHQGLDIKGKLGDPLIAPKDGVVVFSGMNGTMKSGYGRTVEIKHNDGSITRYAHLNKAYVKVGDKLKKGQKFAEIGNTGGVTGPHLHFEILSSDKKSRVDPNSFLSDLYSSGKESVANITDIFVSNVKGLIEGFSTEETNQYLADLGMRESSGRYTEINKKTGYIGKYQFGAMALEDLGYLKKGSSKLHGSKNSKILSDSNNWTGKDGIRSQAAFLNNANVQEKAIIEYTNKNLSTLKRTKAISDGDDKKKIAGMLAGSHLVGPGGMKAWQAGMERKDASGTTASEYFKLGSKSIDIADKLKQNKKSTNVVIQPILVSAPASGSSVGSNRMTTQTKKVSSSSSAGITFPQFYK